MTAYTLVAVAWFLSQRCYQQRQRRESCVDRQETKNGFLPAPKAPLRSAPRMGRKCSGGNDGFKMDSRLRGEAPLALYKRARGNDGHDGWRCSVLASGATFSLIEGR